MDDERLSLEELQEELDTESALWEEMGIGLNQVGHTPDSIFILKQQIQAVLNIIMSELGVSEDRMNIEFKTVMLNSMQTLRASAEEQRREALEKMLKPPMALPDHRIIGPNGEELGGRL